MSSDFVLQCFTNGRLDPTLPQEHAKRSDLAEPSNTAETLNWKPSLIPTLHSS